MISLNEKYNPIHFDERYVGKYVVMGSLGSSLIYFGAYQIRDIKDNRLCCLKMEPDADDKNVFFEFSYANIAPSILKPEEIVVVCDTIQDLNQAENVRLSINNRLAEAEKLYSQKRDRFAAELAQYRNELAEYCRNDISLLLSSSTNNQYKIA